MLKTENILIAAFGTITIIVFIVLVNIGSVFGPESSRVLPEISYIISPYIEGKAITIPLYQIYNFLLLFFSIVLFLRMRNRFAKIGAEFLALSALSGLLLLFFPMDQPDILQSSMGLFHNAIVLVMSLLTTLSLFLFGIAFAHSINLKWLSPFSFSISIVLLGASLITGFFAYYDNALVGIIERFPIGAFLFWILLVAFGILKSDKRIRYPWIHKK